MSTTITEVTECFEYLFSSLYRKAFVKTLRLNECSERELLPLVRCYLLGWFADSVSPEVRGNCPAVSPGMAILISSLTMWRWSSPSVSQSRPFCTVSLSQQHGGKETDEV